MMSWESGCGLPQRLNVAVPLSQASARGWADLAQFDASWQGATRDTSVRCQQEVPRSRLRLASVGEDLAAVIDGDAVPEADSRRERGERVDANWVAAAAPEHGMRIRVVDRRVGVPDDVAARIHRQGHPEGIARQLGEDAHFAAAPKQRL